MLHPPAEDFDAEEVASNPSAAFPAPADPDDQGTLTEPTVTRDAVAPPAPPPPPPMVAQPSQLAPPRFYTPQGSAVVGGIPGVRVPSSVFLSPSCSQQVGGQHVVAAKIPIKEGHEEEAREAMREMVAAVAEEEKGQCLQYDFHE